MNGLGEPCCSPIFSQAFKPRIQPLNPRKRPGLFFGGQTHLFPQPSICFPRVTWHGLLGHMCCQSCSCPIKKVHASLSQVCFPMVSVCRFFHGIWQHSFYEFLPRTVLTRLFTCRRHVILLVVFVCMCCHGFSRISSLAAFRFKCFFCGSRFSLVHVRTSVFDVFLLCSRVFFHSLLCCGPLFPPCPISKHWSCGHRCQTFLIGHIAYE